MARWIAVARADEIPQEGRLLREAEGKRLAIFRLGHEWFALDNHCPHRGGPVGAGPLEGCELTCPWHGQKFHVRTGAGVQSGQGGLRMFPVRVIEGEVQLDFDEPAPPGESPADGIFRALVRYGKRGLVACFGSIRPLPVVRGEEVVVQTDLGLELGEVVAAPNDLRLRENLAPTGQLVRKATPADREAAAQGEPKAAEVLARAQRLAREKLLPVAVVDAQAMLDGQALVLYYLGEPDARLGPLAVGLAQFFGLARVQFQPLANEPGNAAGENAAAVHEPSGFASNPIERQRMKGPDERLKYDLRRVWECPACHHRERSGGNQSSKLCGCQEGVEPTKRRWMKLVEDGPRRVVQAAPRPAPAPAEAPSIGEPGVGTPELGASEPVASNAASSSAIPAIAVPAETAPGEIVSGEITPPHSGSE